MSQYQLPPNDPLFQGAKQTKLSFAGAAYHMKQAWKAMFNHDLTEMQLCIIWSHCAFETAGFSSMKNWNFGNIRKKDKMLYTSYKCHEYLADGSVITYEPYDPKSFFSAWENVQDALKFYLKFLAVR